MDIFVTQVDKVRATGREGPRKMQVDFTEAVAEDLEVSPPEKMKIRRP